MVMMMLTIHFVCKQLLVHGLACLHLRRPERQRVHLILPAGELLEDGLLLAGRAPHRRGLHDHIAATGECLFEAFFFFFFAPPAVF